MEIRKMTIADYDGVYALWMSCRNMGFNDVDDSREGIERFLRRNPETVFIAVEDGEVEGVILGGHDGRRGFIHHMAVREKCRRTGLGTKLLDTCLEAMKREQISKVALLVFKYNEAGNAFWEAQGFTVREDLNYRNKALRELVRIDT
ncbi:MAG: GNAT family N-acetyltransferase [Ruminococcus sp.]|nr:GNAT family N-acetyltransferase [Ruminococcus sp.]MCR5016570.1 GNAT family N-acetyltransferase [Ruminococcus sp.]